MSDHTQTSNSQSSIPQVPLRRSVSEGSSNRTSPCLPNASFLSPYSAPVSSTSSSISFVSELSTPAVQTSHLTPTSTTKSKKHTRSKSLNALTVSKADNAPPPRQFNSETFGTYLHPHGLTFSFDEFVIFLQSYGTVTMENPVLVRNLSNFFTKLTACTFVRAIFKDLSCRTYLLHQDCYQIPVENTFSRHDVSAVLRRTRKSSNHYTTEKYSTLWDSFKENWTNDFNSELGYMEIVQKKES